MPKDCNCNSNIYGKKVTTNAINNIEYSKKCTTLDETILLHDTVIEGKLEVDGKVKVDGKLDVEGKFSLEGKLDVSGLSELNDVLINENLTVLGDTILHNTEIDGSLNVVNLVVSNNANLNNVTIDGSLNIINVVELNHVKINRSLFCSELNVSGNAMFNNNVTVDGTLNAVDLDVSGNAMFNNNVTVDGSLNVVDLDVSGNAMFNNNVTVDGSLNAVDLAVSGNAVFNNNVTVDGSLNAVDLAVSGSTNLNNVVVRNNLIAKKITFPDNTIQTTAYNPNNIIKHDNLLPYFYGTIKFDDNVDAINSPTFTFHDNNDTDTDIVIYFSIFDFSDTKKVYEGYLILKPSTIRTNNDIINHLKIPSNNSPYYSIISTNGSTTSIIEYISIILTCKSSNTSSICFQFKKSILDNTYQINSSIVSGYPAYVNKITIENIDLDNFRSNL